MAFDFDTVYQTLESLRGLIQSRYGRKIERCIGSRVDGDDLYQEVCRRVFGAFESITATTQDQLEHWILTIAKNLYVDIVKAALADSRSVARTEGIGEFEPAVEDDTYGETIWDALNALAFIPGRQAIAVRMRYLEQKDYEAIAAELGTTNDGARILVSRGLKQLNRAVSKM